MNSSSSHLSDPKYGYDFVVATTQASLNGILRRWLYVKQSSQAVQHVCFLADGQGKPTIEISLEELKARTDVDPFTIPDGTDPHDDRITKLTQAGFRVGIKTQIGLPQGAIMLPVVILGSNASSVVFNMFCTQISTCQLTLGTNLTWNVWNQNPMHPWYLRTQIDLVVAHLDRNLDTPYFVNNPDVQQNLQEQLSNLWDTPFDLQQRLFEFKNALVLEVKTNQGPPPGSDAELCFSKVLRHQYTIVAQEQDMPLISVAVKLNKPDRSQLQVTSFEMHVNQLKNSAGEVISNPTQSETEASTFDYYAAVNDKALPKAVNLPWNWVPQVEEKHGIIAINRNTFAQKLLDQLLTYIKDSCLKVEYTENNGNYKWLLHSGQLPDKIELKPAPGYLAAQISYGSSDSMIYDWGIFIEWRVTTKLDCQIIFENVNSIKVVQHLLITSTEILIVEGEVLDDITTRIFDKTISDTYGMSVDSYGELLMTRGVPVIKDTSEPRDDWGTEDLMRTIGYATQNFNPTVLGRTPFESLSNFVFPGARVFTYKEVKLSQYQDLLCDINYIDPARRLRRPKRLLIENSANPILSITSSTEVMQNYIQAEIANPVSRFQALQTSNGYSLLFGVDNSNVLHVIEEQSGSLSGWKRSDLSSAAILNAHLPNIPVEVKPGEEHLSPLASNVVRTYGVGQSVMNGTIGLAMAVTSGTADVLFLSLNNSSNNTSWVSRPSWTKVPFDAVGGTSGPIKIAGIMFAEVQSTGSTQDLLIVDIDRSSSTTVKNIERYRIDMKASYKWVKQDVTADIESGNYTSCVGRVSDDFVDGIYTSGVTAGVSQFVYVPIVNIWGGGPPFTRRLNLPGRAVPSAIATARNDDSRSPLFGTTDLYAISGSNLYRFAADAQTNGSEGKFLLTNNVFSGTDTLFGMVLEGVLTLWGKNSNSQVYYLSCLTTQLSQPGSWSDPLPILQNIQAISPFLNKSDGGNTIFAYSNTRRLQKMTQATLTEAKIWKTQEINLETSVNQKSMAIESFTTTIHITDQDRLPAKNVTVSISADSLTPVYIDSIYYNIGLTPVKFQTDGMGCVTIVEASQDLNSTLWTVAVDSGTGRLVKTIDTMEKSFSKLSALKTESLVRGAQYTSQTVAGGVQGSPGSTPLVNPSAVQGEVQAVASNMATLSQRYSTLPRRVQEHKSLRECAAQRVCSADPFALHMVGGVPMGWFSSVVGNIVKAIKTVVKAVVNFVVDEATKAWNMIVTIGEKVYGAVMQTVEAVVGAIESVWDYVKTGVEKLIQYVKFLFQWDDIKRTKNLMHNVVRLNLKHQIDHIPSFKASIQNNIRAVEDSLNSWGNVTDWRGLGTPAQKPASGSTSDPTKDQNSGSQLFAHHFNDQSERIVVTSSSTSFADVQGYINILISAVSQQGHVLSGVYKRLVALAKDFASKTVEQVLKSLLVILVNGVMGSVEVVVVALMDVLYNVASSLFNLLDTKLHIPIISDILNLIGVPSISFLDLFCWIAAVSYTTVHKIIYNSAPFPDTNEVNALISASSWDKLTGLLNTYSNPSYGHPAPGTRIKPFTIGPDGRRFPNTFSPQSLRQAIFLLGHGSVSFLMFMGTPLTAIEAESSKGAGIGTVTSILGIVTTLMQVATNLIEPKSPITNKVADGFSIGITGITILFTVINSGPLLDAFGASPGNFEGLSPYDGRAFGAILDVILAMPALFVTGWHFYELTVAPVSNDRTLAILEEVSNLTSYMARVSYAFAVNDPDYATKQIAVGVMVVSNVVTSGLQIAQIVV